MDVGIGGTLRIGQPLGPNLAIIPCQSLLEQLKVLILLLVVAKVQHMGKLALNLTHQVRK